MGLGQGLARDWRFLTALQRTLKLVKSIGPTSTHLICDDFEASVDKWRNRPAISFQSRTLTYGELDQMANRFANWARDQAIPRGATVAIFLPNRMEYLPAWMGLSKIGITAALINSHLTGAALVHCIEASGATHIVTDDVTSGALDNVIPDFTRTLIHWCLKRTRSNHRDLSKALKSASGLRPKRDLVRQGVTANSTALLIYTSGTTGLPKAARVTHQRVQLYMRGFAGATGATPEDRIYVTLPLYHATGGLCGMGAALMTGASVVLRDEFSASKFWPDVVDNQCTMFVYIGELCRYLVNQPPSDIETRHKIRLAFGNGLGATVWQEMLSRFRRLNVLEFYGSTEGNVSLFNFDGKPGAIGRVPGFLKKRFPIGLIRVDPDTGEAERDGKGLCVPIRAGEIGECLGKIGAEPRSEFAGYANRQANDAKIIRDVFERGDQWFRTGDLMRQDRQGYFYFVDRLGDTFRWKGENVSTTEVAERLGRIDGIEEATVYGVKVGEAEGRAGMAGLVVQPGFNPEAVATMLAMDLPGYALPVFIRILGQLQTTGTFKYRKADLVKDGFDPAMSADPIFYRNSDNQYVPLTPLAYERIMIGDIRL